MGQLLDLFKQAEGAVGTASAAIDTLEKELAKVKKEVTEFDLQKQAMDNLMSAVSTKSAELAAINDKVRAAQELRTQLTELRHNA